MINTVILIVILVICWILSCAYCYNAGARYQNMLQKQRVKSNNVIKTSDIEFEKNKKFMHELENLFSYDGTAQE